MAFEHIVVVGASLAGLSAIRELRAQGFAGRITAIDRAVHRPYDRPPLSKQFLTGAFDHSDIVLEAENEILDVDWRLGSGAAALDTEARTVTLDDGSVVSYDGLVVATGAEPRHIPGFDLPGVHVLRSVDDAAALRTTLASGIRRIVIVGGGFIGAEVASSARSLGVEATLVEALPVPMGRIIGDEVGLALAELHRQHGVDVRLGVGVKRALGTDRIEGIELEDGTLIEADAVVVSIGVVPSTGWLEGSGLAIDNGIIADETCLVAPGIVAAGDIARWPNEALGEFRRVEHWDNAIRQGEHAARRLLAEAVSPGERGESYVAIPWVWSDQYDKKIQIVGSPAPHDEMKVVRGDIDSWKFVALYRKDDRVVAALGVGQSRHVLAYRARIADGLTWAEALGELVAPAS